MNPEERGMEKIRIEARGEVALLRLANGTPNALDPETVDALHEALPEIARRYHGLVLGGNEKFFSIGLDVPRLLAFDAEAMAAFWNRFEDLVVLLLELPLPTACALGGHATGGGAILALACDRRFGAEGRRLFALNEVQIGVPVPYLAHLLLARLVGDRAARDIEWHSRFVEPAEARELGILDGLFAVGELEAQAVEETRRLARLPREALAVTRRHRNRQLIAEFQARRAGLNREFLDCWFSPSARELLAAAARKF